MTTRCEHKRPVTPSLPPPRPRARYYLIRPYRRLKLTCYPARLSAAYIFFSRSGQPTSVTVIPRLRIRPEIVARIYDRIVAHHARVPRYNMKYDMKSNNRTRSSCESALSRRVGIFWIDVIAALRAAAEETRQKIFVSK